MTQPRILLLDLETAPNVGYTWGKWEQNVIKFVQDWYLLSVGWKWLDEDHVHVLGLDSFKRKKVNDDSGLVKHLWHLFNEADIIIAHNGDQFDIKKSTAKFLALGLDPPTPYKTVDTKKIARRHFKFDSNKLDDLGGYLNLGHKLAHTGFELWEDCMEFPKLNGAAWALMKNYNAQDVVLLEKVYLKLRAWATNHPNLALFARVPGEECPSCGSTHTQRRGFALLKKKIKQRFQCVDCHKWFNGKYAKKEELST